MTTSTRSIKLRVRTFISRTAPLLTLVGLFGLAGVFPAKPVHAAAGINSSVNFQGRLLNAAGAVVADGTYNMQFKIYQDGPGNVANDTGGTLMWTESWVYGVNTPDNRVTVKNGYFSIPLGTICPFTSTTCTASTGNAQTNTAVDFNQNTLWLSGNIGNTTTAATFAGASGDGEMLPMRRMASAVYALNAGQLGGLSSSGYIQNVAPNATQQTGNINILSGAATGVAAAEIQTVASATAPVLILKGGATPGTGADLLQLQNSSSAVLFRVDSAGVIGSADVSAVTTNSAGTTLRTGNSTTSGNTGDLTISTGTATSGNSGNILIDTGGASGTKGSVNIGTTNAAAINLNQNTTIASAKTLTVQGTTAVNSNSNTSAFSVNGSVALLTADTSANRVTVGTVGSCNVAGQAGKFCINQNVAGAGNTTNQNNSLTISNSSPGTQIANVIGISDTSTAIANTTYGQLIDSSPGTNASQTVYSFYAKVSASQPGSFLTFTNGASTVLTVANSGQTMFMNKTNSTASFQVQNAAGDSIFAVDTSGGQIVLGKPGASGVTGKLVVNNATNANIVTLVSGTTSTSYQLTLPVALGSSGDCLKDTTGAGVLGFAACGGAGGSLQGSYTTSAGATPSIAVNSTNKAVTIQNSITSGIAAGNEYFGVRATGASDVVLGNSLFTVNSAGVGINIGGTGNPATSADLSFGLGANRTINVIAQTVANTAGNQLKVIAATGNGTGAGGILALQGGAGGAGATGNGGAATLTGGNAASTNGSGGSVTISGGTKTGSGTGGSVIVKPQASNDTTTAFQVQNAAGTAVLTVDTTNTQLVVRGNAASDAAVLGAEMFTGSYSFPATAGWTAISGSGATATATHTAGGGGVILSPTPAMSIVAGNTYQVTYTISGSTSAFDIFSAAIGGASAVGSYGDTTETAVITATTTGNLGFNPPDFGFTLTSVSVKQLTISKSAFQTQDSAGSTNLEVRSGTGGNFNTFIGLASGQSNTTGADNVALGNSTLQSNTIGGLNLALGFNVLAQNTTGNNNVGVGAAALPINVSGISNVGIGANSLSQNTSGSYNVGIGDTALSLNTIGNNNTAIGNYAGTQDTDGTFHNGVALQNSTSIGAYAQVQASNSIVLGSVYTPTNVGIGTTVPTNTFSVSPLDYEFNDATRTNGSATLTGNVTVWTAAMVGDIIIFSDGTTNTVAARTNNTTITMGTTYTGSTDLVPISYRFHRPGFQVTSAGNAYVQNTNTTAFQVRDSASVSVLTVDSTNKAVIVGSATTDAIQANLQLDSFSTYADTGTCNATTNQGALYYNTNTNAIRTCQDSLWSDVVTTKDTGLLMFGVVPDSGPTPGDLAGVNATDASDGPCKVYMGSVANSVRWTACTVYAYGRRQLIAAQTTDYTASITATASAFQNLCIPSAGSSPTFGTASATETTAALPASWTTSASTLCLATIKEIAAGSGIGAIYDTRVFTTSTKSYASINTAANVGFAVKVNGTVGVNVPTAATTDPFVGVLASYSGTTSATVVNAIVVTNGPVYVKATAGTVGQYIRPTATAGYVNTGPLVTTAQMDIPYIYLGLALTTANAPGTQCSTTANADTCRGSVLTNINIR